MTEPTQAQIEAATTGIDRLKLQFERNHWRITHRVDGKDMPADDYNLVLKAITAAQVEQTPTAPGTTLNLNPNKEEEAILNGHNPGAVS